MKKILEQFFPGAHHSIKRTDFSPKLPKYMGVYVRLSSCMQHPGISITFGDNMKVNL